MHDAPDDMFSAAVALLGDRAAALAETVAALHTASRELLPEPNRIRSEVRANTDILAVAPEHDTTTMHGKDNDGASVWRAR